MNAVRSRITRIHMTDQGCMLRAYSRDIIDAINACREVSTFIPALAYTFALSPAEVEVAHEARAAGTSKYSLYSLIRLNFDLVTGFSVVPLQIFSLFGILIAIGSVLLYFIVMARRILAGAPLDTLITFWDRDILQFFLTGLVLFGVGLVGEYVGRIYQQVRQRPRYLVQAVLERTADSSSDSAWQKRSSSATTT
jgi:undecaprenyl-phosphate 4-deoxy-4-formamido-L-arabinose transferase